MKIRIKNFTDTITSFLRTNATVIREWVMPDKDGTIAFIEDLRVTRTVTGASSSAQTDDNGFIVFNSASPFNFTLNQLTADSKISFVNIGIGAVTFVNGSGVTLSGSATLAGASGTSYPTAIVFYHTLTTPRVITGASSGGGGGATAFTSLTDVPSSYSGQGLKAVRVNTGATALEFYTPSGGGGATAFTGLSDVPSSYTGQALKAVRVNTGATALEFYTPSAGGEADASETVKGIVEEATDAEVTAGTATGATSAKLFVTPAKLLTRMNAFRQDTAIVFSINSGGGLLTTGIKGIIDVPYNCTVVGWEISSLETGSIVLDLWKDTYANYPPTIGDTITGSEKPTISSSTKGQDLTLTTWTTAFTKGDKIIVNVDSVSGLTNVTCSIRVTR